MNLYWNQRFQSEGMIWGKDPSPTAYHAKEMFSDHHFKSIWVPGAGYGRNTKAFSSDFQVDAVELSQDAIRLAEEWDPDTCFLEGSVLDYQTDKQYDGIYCYDVLHLFLEPERRRLIRTCMECLCEQGIVYFTCFSDQDTNCGIGRKLEEGTYEYKAGKYAHFFTEDDLTNHFSGMRILETGSVAEILSYGDNTNNQYMLRYIIAQKEEVNRNASHFSRNDSNLRVYQ